MWTPTTRAQHSRVGLRYRSDLTDTEWAILGPFLPSKAECGRKRAYPMREVLNAICYVLRGGIAWRLMPDTFPPWGNVYRWFARLRDDGTWETINHHLVMRGRERSGRDASPTAAVMDSQSVKTTESGGVRGYDGGKKIKGRKRHALVNTDGRALKLQAHAADIQDRDGAGPLVRASRPSWPFVQLAFADAAYQETRVAAASPIRVEIVRKPQGQVGFAIHAKRWVVERFFACINRNRRQGRGSPQAADPCRIVRKAEGQVGLAVIALRWVTERFLAWISRNRRLERDFERTIAPQRPSSTPLHPCRSHPD